MKGKGKAKLLIALALMALAVGYIAANVMAICAFSTEDQRQRADVAIVLGAAVYGDQVSPVYQGRIDHAITLYREGYVDKLIVTGGKGEGNDISDAEVAKRYTVAQGVPAEDVLTEDSSTITQENLENAKEIMDRQGYETAIVVSDPLHMKRAMLLAKDAGLRAYSSPTPTTRYVTWKTKIPFLARETFFYIGYKWYRVFSL